MRAPIRQSVAKVWQFGYFLLVWHGTVADASEYHNRSNNKKSPRHPDSYNALGWTESNCSDSLWRCGPNLTMIFRYMHPLYDVFPAKTYGHIWLLFDFLLFFKGLLLFKETLSYNLAIVIGTNTILCFSSICEEEW